MPGRVTAASAPWPPHVIETEHAGRSRVIKAESREGLGRLARDPTHPTTVAARDTHGAEPVQVPMDRGVCGERSRGPRPTSDRDEGAVECQGRRLKYFKKRACAPCPQGGPRPVCAGPLHELWVCLRLLSLSTPRCDAAL